MDQIVASRELQVEHKHYFTEFRENERGRLRHITEASHGRGNTVIVPSTGSGGFDQAIDPVIAAANASVAAGQPRPIA